MPHSDSFPSAIPAYAERFPVDVWSHLPSCLTTSFALINFFALLHMHRYDHTPSANASQHSIQCTGLLDDRNFLGCRLKRGQVQDPVATWSQETACRTVRSKAPLQRIQGSSSIHWNVPSVNRLNPAFNPLDRLGVHTVNDGYASDLQAFELHMLGLT